ncbi:MAG: 16S rRNA (cytidine(1402)-2'-O)-methyltransferase [Ignavibacteriales bacterium]|nr:16S rRNA (cytidine(1402)-2'-O)-methyltransferase [Ignavibacteriales bacterium]
MEKSKLYIVSTPIGNYDDITLRAINILQEVDFIICEEYKEAKRLLHHLKIEKELHSLNEHNEKEFSFDLLKLIHEKKSAALISDCGTPLFSDPGITLVNLCIESGIEIIPIPGASSLMAALVGSGFNINKFYFAGWLSPKSDLRKKELLRLKGIKELIIIMETPYRLKSILNDITKVFSEKTKGVIAFNLTLPTEQFYRGSIKDLLKLVEEKNLKGEFVLMIDNK